MVSRPHKPSKPALPPVAGDRSYDLVSVDVGNTILCLRASGLASQLLAACDESEREVLRARLLTRALDKRDVESVAAGLSLTRDVPAFDVAPPAKFVPGAREALAELRRRHVVVTLSNTTSLDARSGDPVSREFPTMARYRSCEIGFAKPDQRAFESVLQREGSRRDGAVHIGDSWECDVLGATAAGWSAIWISADRRPPNSPDGLLAVVSSLREAADLLKQGYAR